jgi:hypothetical protein
MERKTRTSGELTRSGYPGTGGDLTTTDPEEDVEGHLLRSPRSAGKPGEGVTPDEGLEPNDQTEDGLGVISSDDLARS